jgi:hypothetical protein
MSVIVSVSPFLAVGSIGGSFSTANVVAAPLRATGILGGRLYIAPRRIRPEFQIEIRNSAGSLEGLLVRNILGLQWAFLRKGGCDKASFFLIDPPDFFHCDAEVFLRHDVQIKLDVGSGMSTWWRGYVDDARMILGKPLQLAISASGWIYRLERISIVGLGFTEDEGGVLFENLDAAAIARQLIDRANTQGAGLSYSMSSVPDSGFIIEMIQFNESILSALKTLADLAGDAEYGVDRQKNFYFIRKSSTIGNVFVTGKDILSFDYSKTIQRLVNRIFLIGEDPYRKRLDDTASQTDWGIQSEVIRQPSINNDTDAAQWGAAIFANMSRPISRAQVTLGINNNLRIEEAIPIEKVRIKGPRI